MDACVSGDQPIKETDGLAMRFQAGADLTIMQRGVITIWQDIQRRGKRG